MKRYDALRAPKPDEWLALDEAERIALVEAYHQREQISLPNETLHATCHVIVENQLAINEPASVRATLARLLQEGLDRHDAIHAIGMRVPHQLCDVLKQQHPGSQQSCIDELNALTADSYLAECEAAAGLTLDDLMVLDDEECEDMDMDDEAIEDLLRVLGGEDDEGDDGAVR